MLAITIAATKNYLYAWPQCIRSIAAAASHHDEAHFIFATDYSNEGKEAATLAENELPENWKVTVINVPIEDDSKKDYKESAQMRIAVLQGACFAFARKIRATRCLIVESDNILPADAIRVLEWTLDMPTADGSPYYDIAAATYPNGLFLGGFGSPTHQIHEDFLPEERKIPQRLKNCIEACEKRLKEAKDAAVREKESNRLQRLREKVNRCPPDGSVWDVIAKHGWRRRGWMDFAYPGIGRGAIVPSDWCGFGCTLLSAKALAHANFTGYEGRGTQDLFLCWSRWYPAGLRIACVPHIVCDHIKRKAADAPPESPEIIHYRAYHETEGEYRNHLRTLQQPFVPI